MAKVEIRNLRKQYGGVEILKGIDLEIRNREFTCFLGPSGCGKSTLLRMIAGLEEISSGELLINDARMNDVAAAKRNISMVFQSYALYPHMTVRQNMEFGLRLLKLSKSDIATRIAEAAKILQLKDFLDRKPKSLSGGQRQRVAIGRAIVKRPSVFLLDEPLSNLDATLRVSMRVELARLHQDLDATMVYVTHDQVEAMTLADRVVVMRAGRIEQVGTPLELLHTPRNLFVANFVGSPKINMFAVEVVECVGKKVTVSGTICAKPVTIELAQPTDLRQGSKLTMCIRPHRLRISESRDHQISGKIRLVERLGSESLIYVDAGQAEPLICSSEGTAPVHRGNSIELGFSAENCLLFGPDEQALPRLIPADARLLMAQGGANAA